MSDNKIMNGLPLIAVLTLAFIGLAIFTNLTLNKNGQLQRTIDRHSKTFLYKSGATSLWAGSKGTMINYDLRSFDGGNTWYACQMEGAGRDYLKILGEVETIYPGLMKHLDNMDKLFNKVNRDGPLNPGNPNDVALIESVGFQVRTN